MAGFIAKLKSRLQSAVDEARRGLTHELQTRIGSARDQCNDLFGESFDEADFAKVMKDQSKSLAEMQKAIEKHVDQLSIICDAAGTKLDVVEPTLFHDANATVGAIIYAVALYTAIVLYRSPMAGKKTAVGQKVVDNLRKVFESVNQNTNALRTETVLDLDVSAEMRKYVNVQRPSVPMQQAPSPAPASAPAGVSLGQEPAAGVPSPSQAGVQGAGGPSVALPSAAAPVTLPSDASKGGEAESTFEEDLAAELAADGFDDGAVFGDEAASAAAGVAAAPPKTLPDADASTPTGASGASASAGSSPTVAAPQVFVPCVRRS